MMPSLGGCPLYCPYELGKRMPLPTALIFDMDGLMLNSEPLYQAAWQAAARELR